MKGAYILATAPDFFEASKDILVGRGAEYSPGYGFVRYVDAWGRGFEFNDTSPSNEDYLDPPHIAAPGVAVPDLDGVVPYGADCRWEDLFAEVVSWLAAPRPDTTWVLDQGGVIWLARAVDPTKVLL